MLTAQHNPEIEKSMMANGSSVCEPVSTHGLRTKNRKREGIVVGGKIDYGLTPYPVGIACASQKCTLSTVPCDMITSN